MELVSKARYYGAQRKRSAIQFKGQIPIPAIPFDLEHYRVARLHLAERGPERIQQRHGRVIHSVYYIARLKIDGLRLASSSLGRHNQPVFAPQAGNHGSHFLVNLDT
jgi:hypothetical protein